MAKQENQVWQTEWAEIALANSPFPVIWVSSEARIFHLNLAAERSFGYESSLEKALTFFDLDEQLSKKAWKVFWNQLLEEKSLIHQATLTTKRGQSLLFELGFALLEVEEHTRACIICKEISESKKDTLPIQQREDEKFRKLEQRNQLILDSAGEGIYGLDSLGHTTFANEAAVKMIGWKLEDLIGKSQHDILHHSKSDGSPYDVEECPIYAAIKDGKVHTVDNEVFWRKDGTCFPVEYTSTPIKDAEGNLSGAVVIFKDISQRKAAEKALRKSNEELQIALVEVEQLQARLEAENKYLQQEIKLTHNFEEIISQSQVFKKVLAKVEQVAQTDATVLVTGESGTGKELIARAVHNLSERKDRALVKVNCAALPGNLIESELFGHEKGAFTGALSQRIGRFELADGGSIFLDEIGEIPIELQPKLLRVLQEGEFERLGSSRTLKVNVRVIAATNRKLPEEIKKGHFREDLYYRLNVFPIHIPPLRERREDIPLLVNHFLTKFTLRFNKKIGIVTKKVMDELIDYTWMGNIRELENVIERAVITSKGNKLNLGDALPKEEDLPSKKEMCTLEELERAHILKTLKRTHWRVSGEKGAAKILGLKRTTLEARMKKLNIRRP